MLQRLTLPTPVLAALAALSLGACTVNEGPLHIHNERVQIRRDDEQVTEKKRREALTWSEWRDQMSQDVEDRRLPPDLAYSELQLEIGRREVNEILQSIPRDPWAKYERDRREAMFRSWADDVRYPEDKVYRSWEPGELGQGRTPVDGGPPSWRAAKPNTDADGGPIEGGFDE
jgi:hypothetical protein